MPHVDSAPEDVSCVRQSTHANGNTISRIAVGTNHAAQQRDSDFTLIAGILFGIGGSALIAAFQEALHD